MKYIKNVRRFFVLSGAIAFTLGFFFAGSGALIALAIPVYGLVIFFSNIIMREQVFEYAEKHHPEFYKKYPPLRGNFSVYKGTFAIGFISEKDIESITEENIREKAYYVTRSFGLFLGASLIVSIIAVISTLLF